MQSSGGKGRDRQRIVTHTAGKDMPSPMIDLRPVGHIVGIMIAVLGVHRADDHCHADGAAGGVRGAFAPVLDSLTGCG